MNRSPWGAVLGTLVVLVATTLSTYLPLNHIVPRVAERVAGAWAHASAPPRAWLDERMFVIALRGAARPAPALPVGAVACGAIAVVATAGAIALVVRHARSRGARPLVLRLAGQGAATSEIARRTGLAQDAVRLLLSPQWDPSRPTGAPGTSCRSRAAAPAGRVPGPRPQPTATGWGRR
jgi:hypothetical protein